MKRKVNTPPKILFKYPCRGRESVFFESLNSLDVNIRDKNNYLISITIDEDDVILNRPEVLQKINSYSNVEVALGTSKSKIDAINRSMPKNYDWDIVICWSNDMFALTYGFDDIIRDCMLQKWSEDFDGIAHFPEPDSKEYLNVLYVATRSYYERFGYIYHPSYLSLFCDNETMEVGKILGKYHFFGVNGLYEHRNPAYHQYGVVRDELFNEQQSHWGIDEANFINRKNKNFYLNEHPVIDNNGSDNKG